MRARSRRCEEWNPIVVASCKSVNSPRRYRLLYPTYSGWLHWSMFDSHPTRHGLWWVLHCEWLRCLQKSMGMPQLPQRLWRWLHREPFMWFPWTLAPLLLDAGSILPPMQAGSRGSQYSKVTHQSTQYYIDAHAQGSTPWSSISSPTNS